LLRLSNGCILVPKWNQKMATITLKNIPDEIYERLKVIAKLNHRSLNSEIINCLEKSTQGDAINTGEIRVKARLFKEKIGHDLTREEIETLILYGVYHKNS
jgi:plasmid stability protein